MDNKKSSLLVFMEQLHSDLKENNESNIKNLSSLIQFLKNISCEFYEISSSLKIPQFNLETNSQLNMRISQVFSMHSEYNKKFQIISESILEEIIPPIQIFAETLTNETRANEDNFLNLIKCIQNDEDTLYKTQIIYFEESEKLDSLYKIKSQPAAKGKNKNKDIDNQILMQKMKVEESQTLYQKETKLLSKLFNEYNSEFLGLMRKISNIEESLTCMMEKTIKKYLSLMNDNLSFINNNLNDLNNTFKNYNLKDDIFNFNNKFSTKNGLKPWDKIKFISYDEYKQKKYKSDSLLFDANEDGSEVSFLDFLLIDDIEQIKIKHSNNGGRYKSDEQKVILDIYPSFLNNKETEMNKENEIEEEAKMKSEIDFFLDGLLDDKDITSENVANMLGLIYTNFSNINFLKLFFQIFFSKEKPTKYFEFHNLTNYTQFKTVLNNFIDNLNYSIELGEVLDVISSIIIVGENTYYKDNYLCYILSSNPFFQRKEIWEEIFNNRINMLVKGECLKYKKSLEKNKVIQKLSNIFYNYSINNDLILEKNNIRQKVEEYNFLDDEEKKIVNQTIIEKYIHPLIKQFIMHMLNYRLEPEICLDIVLNICKKYELPKASTNFYMVFINTSLNNIKIKKLNPGNKNDTKEKILDIKKFNVDTTKKYPVNYNNNSPNNNIVILLENIFPYLNNKQKLELLLLNKNISENLHNKIYGYFLQNTFNAKENHLHVWKSLLKCSTLKKKYDYKTLVKISEKNEAKKKYRILELDIKRTYFKSNLEESKGALNRILKSFVSSDREIEYCQGMSYIATFLYDISNEEECYYLILGIFKNSDFHKMFESDMKVLKGFFKILERLLKLYLPEILSYFDVNEVEIHFFASAWFITLFTVAYQHNLVSESKIYIKIMDDFLLHGWISIFSSILAVIQYHADKILTCKNDNLLAFLINDLFKSEIFKDENLDKFLEIRNRFQIEPLFFKNLMEEFEIEYTLETAKMIHF